MRNISVSMHENTYMRVAPALSPRFTPLSLAAPAVVSKPVSRPSLDVEQTRGAAVKFFDAFKAHDLETLKSMYRPDATFKDDMFDLSSRESIMKMWSGAPPFAKFDVQFLETKSGEVKTRWTADYEMFGNKVHNVIDSTMRFDASGRVVSQREHWDEQKWMSQALPAIPKWAQGIAYHFMRPILSWQMGG